MHMMMPEPVVMIVPVMRVAVMIMSIVIMPVLVLVPVLAAIMRGVRSAVGIMIMVVMVVMVMPAGGGRAGAFSACRGGWLIVRGGATGSGAAGQTVYGIRRRGMVLRCAGGRVRMRAGGRGRWLRHGMSLRVGGGVPVASGRCPA